MNLITQSLLYLTVITALCFGVWAHDDNSRLRAENVDLTWRNVTIEQRKYPLDFKGLNYEAASKAANLTGIPMSFLINMRKMENGGDGYEYGYRGKSQGVVENYTPPQWQYGEAARRMNEFLWEWVELDKKRHKEATEYLARRYTGRNDSKGYAACLRMTP